MVLDLTIAFGWHLEIVRSRFAVRVDKWRVWSCVGARRGRCGALILDAGPRWRFTLWGEPRPKPRRGV